MVAGGYVTPTVSVEKYFPQPEPEPTGEGSWSAMESMNTPRYGHTATALQNGNTLVAGGNDGGKALDSAELFDFPTEWSFTSNMAAARFYHSASRLSDGRVLVAGGSKDSEGYTVIASAEVYDPAEDAWSATGSMATARKDYTATLLSDGRVLVAGGHDGESSIGSAEVYGPR